MLLAGLGDGLVSLRQLLQEIRSAMPFFQNMELRAMTVEKYGLRGKQLKIKYDGPDREPARTFPIIQKMIRRSKLPAPVQKHAISVFQRIATVEGRIHGISFDKVHFHEISAADTLLDVIGVCMALYRLGTDTIYCSPLPLGNGTVAFSHGTWPLPAPAALELIGDAPVYKTDVMEELVTPTGAALIREFVSHFGASPVFKIEKIGQGFGTAHRPKLPNILRVMMGRLVSPMLNAEHISELVTVVDDISGVVLGHAVDKCRASGALDVYVTPIQMKKGRPGFEVRLLCKPADTNRFYTMLFEETGTLGVRVYPVQRVTLPRKSSKARKHGFDVETKIVKGIGGRAQHRIEYESLKKIAGETRLPLKHVHEAIQ